LLPSHALSNIELKYFSKILKIKNFRNIYMRDNLPRKPYKYERGIINLDGSTGEGTHWVCYIKENKDVHYFDSFGNLLPPKEFLKYVKNCNVYYNRKNYQSYNTVICGHLCLLYLCL
jgi:hypothetical protein